MATTFKLIKKRDFVVNKDKHVHYTVAYKGRVFGVNTLRFEADAITADEKAMTLVVTGDLEVLKESFTDPLTSETTNYLAIVPKMDMALAAF